MPLAQSTRNATLHTPLGGDTLVFKSLSITEQFGRLFSLEIAAVSEKGDIKGDSLLGKAVSVEMECPRGGSRCFHGFVSRLVRVPRPGSRYFTYHLTAVPWLWFLTRTADCRIFQNKAAPDILREVFGRHGFGDFKFRLTGTYTPWEYCVQYRETDFNFASRIMEQEGIYYYFEHEKDKHTVIFADAPGAHQPFLKYETLTFRPMESVHEYDDEHIYEWAAESRHHTGKYLHTDYDFTRPNVDLKAPTPGPGKFAQANLEIFDYPGEYDKEADGDQWSRVRMEELRADQEIVQGGGDVTGLVCGHKFTFAEPPHPSDAGDYVLTSTSIHLQSNAYEGGDSGDESELYHCSFTAIQASEQFRPARHTPKPLVQGLQTAIVTGRKDDEIYTDKYGRVKVQFHWDREGKRDENTTCFIRVAEFWAGRRWGSTFTPRVGQEVVVAFLEGDPDQPLIIGSVYNAVQMPPYLGDGPDPKHTNDPNVSGIKSCSTKGGNGYNELRFDDTKGKEEVFVHAEKDLDTRVKNDTRTDVGGSMHLTVGFQDASGELYGFIKEKIYRTKYTHALKTIGAQADQEHFIYVGSQGQAVKQVMVNSGEMRTTASRLFSVKAPQIVLEGETEVCLTCGPSFIKIGPDGIYLSGPMIYINSGGASSSASDSAYLAPLEPDKADDSKSGSPSD